VTLLGGFDQIWNSKPGMTTIQGPLTIASGSIVADRVVVR
jgi:hypothetical protein